jgi:hypothetical protein
VSTEARVPGKFSTEPQPILAFRYCNEIPKAGYFYKANRFISAQLLDAEVPNKMVGTGFSVMSRQKCVFISVWTFSLSL